ncbi:RsmB/NOP family class I SAM-dependent RNA methyltransferase [Hyphobacterium sp.]|uniref:RsmB/NOP family class I SAM-dependent RNA methyltransferase n=1 Tax=Hyphobacterium sp. TaxID=2004662 RepID=UPI003747867B
MNPGLDARRASVRALKFVLESRTALDAALSQTPEFGRMESRDKAFARLISATTLRRRGQIHAVLSAFLEHDLPEHAGEARLLLETATAQILFLDTKPHAAVSEAVTLAKTSANSKRFSGLINAVLRKVVAGGREIADATPLSDNLPNWLRDSWQAAYGIRTVEDICAVVMRDPPLDLSLRQSPDSESLAEAIGAAILPTGTLRKPEIGDLTALPGFDDGEWWAQDAGAALPARLLNAQPGESVLDLCAAPGGKTMQLAATGASVTALDASPKRMRRVADNLGRTQLAAECVTADGQTWGEAQSFDAVLLDAPCSATGTLRRRPDAAWIKNQEDIASLIPIQNALLDNATRLLKPGGLLVICTCSLQPEEGEFWLDNGLARHPELEIDAIRPDELPELEDAIQENGAVRLTPDMWADRGGIDGFFIARLRKTAKA